MMETHELAFSMVITPTRTFAVNTIRLGVSQKSNNRRRR
ncbi:hypothetical protein FTUN_2186 [Frigoriglobus tundricola]|uniref:Uncharacterized protein n=1 Tax=Frigoriglobus tundricola TaxID=2774151 RepID=A0A6M5YM48_9BACT|nr:hypothetical protein FTUN_2186 [Frigoriglobus tundricola]